MSIPLDFVGIFPDPKISQMHPRRPQSAYQTNTQRPPSQLPPSGHSRLSFTLGKVLGAGNSGVIHEVLDPVVEASEKDSSQAVGHLPPLVAKIGWSHRCYSIVREGWFYEEMECLQGVAIPRCYGCFELKLQKALHIGPWEDSGDEIFDSLDFIPEHEHYSLSEMNTVGIAPHPLSLELIHTPHDRVYILLLERMGDELSPGVNHPESVRYVHFVLVLFVLLLCHDTSELISECCIHRLDIKSVYEDIAHVGVSLALDIRSCNILGAPASNPNIPGPVSPFKQRSHAWRIVNFDLALKTPYTPRTIFSDARTWIDNMFYGLRLLPRPRIRRPTPSTR